MSLTLTANDQKLISAVISQMADVPAVDFQKVADETDIKYARNARSAFKRVWEKLKATPHSPQHMAKSPIKKSGHTTPLRPPSPRVRPIRNRRKSEKAVAFERLKAEYPSDADEDTDDEKYHWRGTPDSEISKSPAFKGEDGDDDDSGMEA